MGSKSHFKAAISSVECETCAHMDYSDLYNCLHVISDLIAIPDFGPGAMENWGLITYRMSTLLFEPTVSTDRDKESVAIVIAHELAHQVLPALHSTHETHYLYPFFNPLTPEFVLAFFIYVECFRLFISKCESKNQRGIHHYGKYLYKHLTCC